MKQEEAVSILTLAGFKTSLVEELPNGYWPDVYEDLRKENPWWFIKTDYGWIKMGWRKRVISISWEDVNTPVTATPDEVTKWEFGVHAYSISKAVEYMTSVCKDFQKQTEAKTQ